MGYESKLFIVHKKQGFMGPKPFWGDIVAEFNLAVCSSVADTFREKPETDCYIYADDGNTLIQTDKYDKPLTEASIDDVIEVLAKKELSQEGRPYRRIEPLYAMLKSFKENSDQWDNLAVLHYGY